LLTGKSPCHGFNQIDKCTGGFYHIVCRHGASIISKTSASSENLPSALVAFGILVDSTLMWKHVPLHLDGTYNTAIVALTFVMLGEVNKTRYKSGMNEIS